MYDLSEYFPERDILPLQKNTEYRKLSFVTWCNNNHLKLNINETNELVVDHKRKSSHTPTSLGMDFKQ